MAALTADLISETKPRGGRNSYVVKNGVQIFAGSLVNIDADGFMDKHADTTAHRFIGIALEGATGNTSASPPVEIRVDESGTTLRSVTVASAVQASVNSLVHCTTDNPADMTMSAGSHIKAVGIVTRYISAGVADVELLTPAEHQAIY